MAIDILFKLELCCMMRDTTNEVFVTNKKNHDYITPMSWLPAGLITWYAPSGTPLALVTSWIALVGGDCPRIRTAWHGRQNPLSRFWSGGDFAFNVPSAVCLRELRHFMQKGAFCLDIESDLGQHSVCGISSVSPLLTKCAIQLECRSGQLLDSDYDTELAGDVVRLHRGQRVINVSDVPDLCAIQPLCL